LIRTILHFFFAHTAGTLFILLTIEEAGIPIPIAGDYLIALAGTRSHQSIGYAIIIISTASLAVFLGSSLLFLIARRQGRSLIERYGKYIFLDQKKVKRLEQWVSRYGPIVLLIGRLTPGLRIPTTVVAGISNMPYQRFCIFTGIAAIIWSSLYFFLGALLGRELRRIVNPLLEFFDTIPRWILFDSAFIVLLVFLWLYRDRLQRAFVGIRDHIKHKQ
jgi:membrane protein DedA with SNARE-associated domain